MKRNYYTFKPLQRVNLDNIIMLYMVYIQNKIAKFCGGTNVKNQY